MHYLVKWKYARCGGHYFIYFPPEIQPDISGIFGIHKNLKIKKKYLDAHNIFVLNS